MIPYHIIAGQTTKGIIGIDNKLFCECREDLTRFYHITTEVYPESRMKHGMYESKNILIMGYNTWLSIPESVRPFKKRMSVVVSKNHTIPETSDVTRVDSFESAFHYCAHNTTGRVFVIGGTSLFTQCAETYPEYCQNLYLTHYDVPETMYDVSSAKFHYFPENMCKNTYTFLKDPAQRSECIISTPLITSRTISHQFMIYQKHTHANRGENEYLRVLQKIFQDGERIHSRNSTVYSSFGERMVFDLQDGFPLLTTKRMGYKTILRELLWFIRGSTDNQSLQDKKVHIWDKNASKEFLQSRGLSYKEGDLGPVYGFQWRHSGAEYKGCHENYGGKGYDQLQEVIRLLKEDPQSRRILMSAWNPTDVDKMALPPCHVMCQFYVRDNTLLDCQLYQRSGDMFLGVPFNIASYSFLTHIIAKITGYQPGRLIHILGDAHIYENHMTQVREQLKRVPVQFPSVFIQDSLTNIDTICEEMIHIESYKSYPQIKGDMIA